jgi:hypothetical protein
MPALSELSPFVLNILDQNHFTPVRVLRYGPRFICLEVRSGERRGMFKMVLPVSERTAAIAPPDYKWTEYERVDLLEKRLLKEALFLQFFSQQLGGSGFEPQIIALSETSPVWSLRTYIDSRPMSAWDSNFIFSQRFYKQVTPRQAVDFFHKLHRLSDDIPQSLADLVKVFTSTLVNTSRFDRSVKRAATMPQFAAAAERLRECFAAATPRYRDYRRVITQYEPYSCHLFVVDGKLGLIDWENVGWGHPLQDLSVLWMRCFEAPEWQSEYVRVMEEYGYFEGNGRLFWESELLIQSFANHQYFADGGPVGTPEYDQRGSEFFVTTIEQILTTSDYFKA